MKISRSCFRNFGTDVTPKSDLKLFQKSKGPPTIVDEKCNNFSNSLPNIRNESEYRENDFHIQMISRNLHNQIFGNYNSGPSAPDVIVQRHKDELKKHGINLQDSDVIPNVRLKIPKLRGENIVEHFKVIAMEQVKPYEDLLKTLINFPHMPSPPLRWVFREGWTQYKPDSYKSQSVDFPTEDGLILDVEVCMSVGSGPTLATAVSSSYWYSWVSPHMFPCYKKNISEGYQLEELIPLGTKGPKLVVGHNVAYDRARIREQYFVEDTKVRFIDTMSLHICVSGVTSYQRTVMKSKKEHCSEDLSWMRQSSLNSLGEVYKLYCNGEIPSKEPRNVFANGTLDDIRKQFQDLMSYCANDVIHTQKVLKMLFPLFEERFPNPVTLAGMLELGSSYLPVNSNWLRFINESNLAYDDLNIEAKFHLLKQANDACHLLINNKYKSNLWLWDQDWSIQELKMKKTKTYPKKLITESGSSEIDRSVLRFRKIQRNAPLFEKFKHLYEMKNLLPVRRPLLPGYPAWYRKLCQKRSQQAQHIFYSCPNATEVGIGMQISPKILSLCWEGFPLHYIKEQGWGFLVPFTPKNLHNSTYCTNMRRIPIEELINKCAHHMSTEATRKENNEITNLEVDSNHLAGDYELRFEHYRGSGVWCNTTLDNCCYFLKLPHKNGIEFRVGNPLSKDFINKFYDNVLTSENKDEKSTERIINIARMMSYWKNNRDRINKQMVVWLSVKQKRDNGSNIMQGAICPQVVVCGTLTRRAMEPTWMTASNSHSDRIGSELRSMVQVPETYKIIGADVDSQELWIASILGDAYSCGTHGATPLGWMTLSGSKSNGTDLHSITAKAVGISREHAKVVNYARMYGAGPNFANGLLKQFKPSLTNWKAKEKAMKMYSITKGEKIFEIRSHLRDQYAHKSYTGREAMELALKHKCTVEEMFYKSYWKGGTESAMFNRIEEIALRRQPKTPFLEGRLSRPLEGGKQLEKRFLPTRVNWVVQSGAVDFLHLMLVSMRWLMGSNIRFCLSFHDELRYMTKEDMAYKAALAMHITNLLTRSYCSLRLGINDLPMAVAFFSSVEIDTVLRKECTMDCKTPSNPHGLQTGYGIHNGESLNIYDAIKKAEGGDLSQWDWIM